jgi:hypothetical protein
VHAEWDEEVDDALSWEMQLLANDRARQVESAGEEHPDAEEVLARASEGTPQVFAEDFEPDWPEAPAAELAEDPATDMSRMELVAAENAEPPRAPAVFITETMAQLYEQQGYLEMAAAVYRQLLERAPENDRIKAAAASLENRLSGSGDRPTARGHIAIEEGDSARDFFSSLVQVPLRPRLARPYSADRANTPHAGGSTIADAGSPAREASSALSLDSVFKNGTARPGVSGGFSFDNFFADNSSASPTGSQKERSPRATRRRRGEDARELEQFNSWLEGLKRS